jgi:BlaR1 peptidase M56
MTRALRQSATPIAVSANLQAAMRQCCTALGVKDIALFASPSIIFPMTMGLRCPVIILPERLLSETSVDLLNAAIGHELAHIRRRDYAWNIIYELLYLPLSFHPAAALVKRRINETRELACDEMVSELILDAKVYARSLVSLANSSFSPNHPNYTLGVNDADILEERVMKLLMKKNLISTQRATALLSVTLFALAIAGATAAAFPISIQEGQNQTVAAAKPFVGAWKRITPGPPTENAYIFMLDGVQLKGTIRTAMFEKPAPGTVGELKLVRDLYAPLPNLTVEGRTLTWTSSHGNSSHMKASFVSEDELLVEVCMKQACSPDRPADIKETLKRQR